MLSSCATCVPSCVRSLFAPWCRPSRRGYEVYASSSERGFSAVQPRTGQTTEQLAQLKTIKNIRDLSEACGAIAPGRVFRSACPVNAAVEDVELVGQVLRVQRMIDLRSDYERQADVVLRDGFFSRAQVFRNHRTRGGLVPQLDKVLSQTSAAEEPLFRVDNLSFIERDRYYRAMLTTLPYQTTASILFWGLFNQSHAKTLAIREINKAGLPGLYRVILQTSGPEICQALTVVTEAAEAGRGVLFFCKIGKDRTGILASLILACCGATADEIISDYARSDGVEQVALGDMEADKEIRELDTALFSRAPPEAMRATLDWCQAEFGGLRGYLHSVGFGSERQRRLARALAPANGESSK